MIRKSTWAWTAFVGVFLVQAWFVTQFGVNSPNMDDWANASLFHHYNSGTLTFGELFAQHVDHRLLVVRLIFLGLYSLFGEWNLVVEMLGSALFLGAAAGCLVYSLRRVDSSPSATLLICAVLTSPVQWENILMGFQIQFYVLVLLQTVAICLIAITERPSGWLFVLVGTTCVVSTFTMGSGMFSWGIAGVCFCVKYLCTGEQPVDPAHRLRLKPIFFFSAAAVLCAVAYLHGYVETNPDLKAKSLGTFLLWTIRALNYPLLETPSFFRYVLAVGQWGVIGTVVLLHFRHRTQTKARVKLTLMIGFTSFLFLNAAITGYRRSGTMVDYPKMEIVSRYASIFLWSTVIFLMAAGELLRGKVLTKSWRCWVTYAGLLSLVCGVLTVHAGRYIKDLTRMSDIKAERLLESTTVINYLRDSSPNRQIHGPPPIFEDYLKAYLSDGNVLAQLPSWLQAAGRDLPATLSGDAWTKSGVSPATLPEDQRMVWGSWSGADAKTGQLRSASFEINKPVLVLPLCGFPTAKGNSLAITSDTEPGKTIVYEGPAVGEKWTEWRPNVSSLMGGKAHLVAVDACATSDGWFGFAVPWQTSRLENYLERLIHSIDFSIQELFEFKVVADSPEPQTMQLFYLKDGQTDFNESSSVSLTLNSNVPRVYRFPLPPGSYTAFRFDPMNRAGQATFQNARICETRTGIERYKLPVKTWSAVRDIDTSTIAGDVLSITALKGHDDPILLISLPANKLLLDQSTAYKFLSRLMILVTACGLAFCIYWLTRKGPHSPSMKQNWDNDSTPAK